MAGEVFGAAISLKDNVSGVLRQAIRQSKSFSAEVSKAKDRLRELDKQKIREKELRIKNTQAYKSIEAVSKKLEPLTKKVVEIKAREELAVAKIRKVSTSLGKIKDNKVVNIVVKGAESAVKTIEKGALIGAAAGFTAVAAAGTVAVNSAVGFQAQMANVSTLLDGDVTGKVQALGAEVKKLSMDTGIYTDNLSGGLYEVISAFGETADNTKQLETAAKAAKAGNAETADSVRMLSAVTKGYGDTSADAVQKASDLAFLTVKLGQTSFPELAASMGSVVPLASTLKVSQEELFGAMSTLTGVTGSTSEVTTQLKATMQGFMSPTKQMSEALKTLGYDSGAAALESESLGSILGKLKESVGGNEVAFAGLFSSVEAQNAVLALAGSQAENFTNKTAAMYDAAGATDAAFKKQTSSVSAMAAKLKNSGLVILTSVGEKALPVLSNALERVAGYMPQFEAAVNSAMSAMGPIFQGAGSAISLLWDAWSPALDSLGPSVSSVISQVSGSIQTALPVVSTIFNGLSSVAQQVFPVIAQIVQDAGGKVTRIFTVLGSHTGTLQSIFEAAGPAISTVLSTAWSVVSPVLDLAVEGVNLMASVVGWAFPYIQGVITSVWSVIEPVISAVGAGIEAVAGVFKKAASAIGGSAAEVSASADTVSSAAAAKRPGANANGTSYWRGGYTTINEHGPELVQLPAGSKIYSATSTRSMERSDGSVIINIQNAIVREEADIRKIAQEIVKELQKTRKNM